MRVRRISIVIREIAIEESICYKSLSFSSLEFLKSAIGTKPSGRFRGGGGVGGSKNTQEYNHTHEIKFKVLL